MNHGMPCKRDCPDRTGTCHDTCEAFLEWKKRLREMKEGLRKERAIESHVIGLNRKGVEKAIGGRK